MTVTAAPRTTGRRAAASARRASTPAWSAVAAWGAGLVAIALGAGALPTATVWAVALLAIGGAALAWGAVTLARGSVVTPRIGIAGALAGIGATVGTLFADPARTSPLAVVAASVLFVLCALACARQVRRPVDAAAPRVAVLLVSAVVVAAIVTPALGATEAGLLAPDHGTHGIVDPGHH